MSHEPYQLPRGWRWVQLGEIFNFQQGASVSPKRRLGKNPYPFLRTKNVLWGEVDIRSLDRMDFTEAEVQKLPLMPGDLLVCEGGDVGRTAVWEGQLEDVLYQNHIHRLRPAVPGVESRFFMYWMQAAYQVFKVYTGEESRTAIPNLSARKLEAFQAPLPPLEEQRRIVARVDALMERVREARALRTKALEETERLMPAALTEVFPRPEEPLLPNWRWVRLGDVCEHQNGVWGNDPLQEPIFPVVRSTEICGFVLDPLRAAVRSVPSDVALRYELRDGDILVNRSSGSPHLVGWPAIFQHPKDSRKYLFSNFMLRLRTRKDIALPWFVLYYLHSPIARSVYLQS